MYLEIVLKEEGKTEKYVREILTIGDISVRSQIFEKKKKSAKKK